MAHTILILLAVSLDVFSFGLTLGFDKIYLSSIKAMFFTLVSCIIFAVPLALSKLLFYIIPKYICFLINGVVLLLLGVCYLSFFIFKQFIKRSKFKQNGSNTSNFNNRQGKYHRITNSPETGLKYLAFCAVPVNLDAFFTALLSGFSFGNFYLVLVLYFVFTFIAVYASNKISFFISKKINLDLTFISGILFIVLGILKLLN